MESVALRIMQWHPEEPIQVQGQLKETLNWKTLCVYSAHEMNSAISAACMMAKVLSDASDAQIIVYNNSGYEIKTYYHGKEIVR